MTSLNSCGTTWTSLIGPPYTFLKSSYVYICDRIIMSGSEPQKQGKEKKGKQFVSEDKRKLNNFYSFRVSQDKFHQVNKNANRQIMRFAITGVIFGFFTQWLLGNGKIYSNIVKKSTMRRLSTYSLSRRKEEIRLKVAVKGYQKRRYSAMTYDLYQKEYILPYICLIIALK